jgi:putative SOS response-associated peptidase YedK
VKQPYNFGVADDALFAFAGLWERWRDSGQRIHRNLHNPNYQSKPPWLAAQLRIVALFDRSIERIHIDMDNFSHNQRVAK